MPDNMKLVGPIRKTGPTYGMQDVAKLLGTSEQWVYKLAIRDPEEHPKNHLAGYVKNPDGPGWIRKIGTYAQWEAGHERVLMFYESDVKKYIEEHQKTETKRTNAYTVRVSPEEEALIVELAEEQIKRFGYVNRTLISKTLQTDEAYQEYHFSARVYDKVLATATKYNWPMSARAVKLKERLA